MLTLSLIFAWMFQDHFSPPLTRPLPYIPAQIQSADLDFSDIRTVSDKKKRFFEFMRPIIEHENIRIMEQRLRLQNTPAKKINKKWLARLARDYGVKMGTIEETRKKLLTRVDIIPLELALAQSANERSWGQSRFALEANNMFGQWCLTAGCGLVPRQRDEDQTHEVSTYSSVNDSVRSYLLLLNSGKAFHKLRLIRRQHRDKKKQLNALALAEGLSGYSARGQSYIREIQSIIRINKNMMRPTKPSFPPIVDTFSSPSKVSFKQ